MMLLFFIGREKKDSQKHVNRFSSEFITIHVRVTDFMDVLLLYMYQWWIFYFIPRYVLIRISSVCENYIIWPMRDFKFRYKLLHFSVQCRININISVSFCTNCIETRLESCSLYRNTSSLCKLRIRNAPVRNKEKYNIHTTQALPLVWST
jgi:hypothetical protein